MYVNPPHDYRITTIRIFGAAERNSKDDNAVLHRTAATYFSTIVKKY